VDLIHKSEKCLPVSLIVRGLSDQYVIPDCSTMFFAQKTPQGPLELDKPPLTKSHFVC
jgi:hypothetical protein